MHSVHEAGKNVHIGSSHSPVCQKRFSYATPVPLETRGPASPLFLRFALLIYAIALPSPPVPSPALSRPQPEAPISFSSSSVPGAQVQLPGSITQFEKWQRLHLNTQHPQYALVHVHTCMSVQRHVIACEHTETGGICDRHKGTYLSQILPTRQKTVLRYETTRRKPSEAQLTTGRPRQESMRALSHHVSMILRPFLFFRHRRYSDGGKHQMLLR